MARLALLAAAIELEQTDAATARRAAAAGGSA